MSWRELRVVVPRSAAGHVSTALFDHGAAGVQEDWLPGEAPPPRQPWDTGPPPPLPDTQVLLAWFEGVDEAAIVRALPASVTAASWSDVPEQDWENGWKDGFEPIHIHDGLVVAPPWNAPDGALIIEPGQGFGTGDHPSTRQALTLQEEVMDGVRTALDVGCGSGVLALAAARHGVRVRGIDVEPAAIADAHANAARNGLHGDFDTTPLDRIDGTWDLVLANLHAELLERLGTEILARTGRWLVCAGILSEKADRVRAVFEPHLELDRMIDDGSWVGLRYRVR